MTETAEKPWTQDDTLALVAIFGRSSIDVAPPYGVHLKDSIDLNSLPTASPLTPEEMQNVMFAVIPATSWNGIQKEIIEYNKQGKGKFRTGGRSYQIPVEDLILGPPDPIWFRVMMKLRIETTEQNGLPDFANTVRWGDAPIDENQYPFAVVTQGAWNTFQWQMDELGIRKVLRNKVRPVAQKISKKAVFRVTHQKFAEWKSKGF